MNREILHLTACSDLRRNILISMIKNDKSLGDLRKELNISSTTALHALKDLEKNNLTFQQKNKNYALTNVGKIITLKLVDFGNAAEVMKKHERFWLEHDISGIPEHLMEKVGWLKNSNLIQINPLDIIKTHSSYINYVKKAKWIKGISSIYSPDYPDIFKQLVLNNIDTSLILNDEVFNKIAEITGRMNLDNAIINYKLEFLITKENLKLAFTVTDSFFSMGLFNKNGIYDTAFDLISTDNLAIQWGIELFNYYCNKAMKYEVRI
ncbi:MAG: winged helix-turn-helix domain-containing protein [Candidatus Methanoperedens sp.]|nr:winged helix-turn-helix domain-containing protein [Candidatus Methanoperedens sp.]